MIFDPLFIPALLHTILLLPLFLIAVFTAFYIPGKLLLGNKEKGFSSFVLSLIIGITLWAYQGVIFGYLGIRWASYIYVIVCFLLWIIKCQFVLPKIAIKKQTSLFSILLLCIFIFGILGQVQQFFFAGLFLSNGLHLFTGATVDALWYSSIVIQLTRRFPPFEPGLSGVVIHNYHYWSAVVTAELLRVFRLPLLQTQFQFMYILLSFLLGSSSFILARKLKFSSVGILLFVYLQYFYSNIIYLLTLFTRHAFIFTFHPLLDGTIFLENPPRAFSFVVTLAGIICLYEWLQHYNKQFGLLPILLLGSVIGFKVNTGILVLSGLAGVALYFIIKHDFKKLIVPFLTLVISLAIYFPVNKNSGLLVFVPFEWAHMFSVNEAINLSHFELARRIYLDHFNYLQALRMDITMFAIFMIAQFGVVNFGWFPTRSFISHVGKPFTIFLYSGIIVSILLGTLFLQPAGGYDIFNFFIAGCLFLSLIAAFNGSILFKNKQMVFRVLLILLLFGITIPRWVYKSLTIRYYIQKEEKTTAIGRKDFEIMNIVKGKTTENDIVLVFNKGQWDGWYPYVSAFTQRDMFLSGQTILQSHGIDYKKREEIVNRIRNSHNSNEVKKLLIENNITVLYIYSSDTLSINLSDKSFEPIYTSTLASIYRFHKE
jgi:hypothetical protein